MYAEMARRLPPRSLTCSLSTPKSRRDIFASASGFLLYFPREYIRSSYPDVSTDPMHSLHSRAKSAEARPRRVGIGRSTPPRQSLPTFVDLADSPVEAICGSSRGP
ncbi:hypothetical protein B0H13DRAFT_2301107 [Mycena leptocephala]|nr:hypothetical protein B0H13DRAFT_2301107 [Mycena leptocephala]